jgi:hypothetical protein
MMSPLAIQTMLRARAEAARLKAAAAQPPTVEAQEVSMIPQAQMSTPEKPGLPGWAIPAGLAAAAFFFMRK